MLKNFSFLNLFTFLYVLLYVLLLILIYLDHTLFSSGIMVTILFPAICFIILLLISMRIKFNKENNFKRKIKRIILTVILFPAFCVVMLTINESYAQFTVDNWESNKKDRRFMFQDLRNEYELKGMNKEELKSLLGSPTTIDNNGSRFIYYMGDSSDIIPVDSTLLRIDFNKNEKINKYEVFTD